MVFIKHKSLLSCHLFITGNLILKKHKHNTKKKVTLTILNRKLAYA